MHLLYCVLFRSIGLIQKIKQVELSRTIKESFDNVRIIMFCAIIKMPNMRLPSIYEGPIFGTAKWLLDGLLETVKVILIDRDATL